MRTGRTLCRAYDIAATPPGQPGYQSVLSQLTLAVTGRSVFYFVTMAAVLTVLALSANTSFADFPRLCGAIAENRYLPDPFTIRGRRLVFSFGVYGLVFLAASLLILVEDHLRPAAKQVIEIPQGHRFGFLNLRHALTSFLVEIGTDSKTIQDMLRWADPSILLKVYAHSRMDKRMEAQAKMIDAMGLNEETAQRFIQ